MMRFFKAKGQKTINVGKTKKNKMKSVFSKKQFSSFKKPSLRKWEAQNMPLVAGLFLFLPFVPHIEGIQRV